MTNNHEHLATLIKELDLTEETALELNLNPMDTQLHHTLSGFEEVEFPQELHGRIMRSLYLSQFKTPLVIINTILAANFGISSYQLSRIMGPTLDTLVRAGAVHAGTLSSSLGTVLASTPVSADLVFAVNLALLAGGGYLFWKLHSLLQISRASQPSEA